MRKRDSLLEAFEKGQMQKSQPDYFKHLKLFGALYREARQLGLFPPKDPLEGIDVDIRLARALNARTISGEACLNSEHKNSLE